MVAHTIEHDEIRKETGLKKYAKQPMIADEFSDWQKNWQNTWRTMKACKRCKNQRPLRDL